MTIREIRFGVRAVDTNGAAAGGTIDTGVLGAPNEIQPGWMSTSTQRGFQQLVAFADTSADRVGTFPGTWGVVADTAYNLSDMNKDGAAGSLLADDTAAGDPVLLRAHGQLSGNFKAGDLTGEVRFSDAAGFGLGNRADAANAVAWLNNGDAIDVASSGGEPLRSVAFTVNLRDTSPTATTTLALDVDGSTLIATGTGKNAAFATNDLLELAGLHQGDKVRIDLIGDQITVNGTPQTVAASFWTAVAAAGGDNLTLGIRHDSAAAFALKDLHVTVGTPDDHPVATTNDAYNATEDTTLTLTAAQGVLANDSAPDGGLAAVAGTIATAQGGSVALAADGSFTYTPAANVNGGDSFSYTARDSDGDTATATVSLAVAAVNDPPVAQDDTVTTNEDTTLTLTAAGLLANDSDPDGDTLAISAVGGAVHGSVALGVNDDVLFTPAAGFSGQASFTYTAADGQGGSDTGTVAIEVLPDIAPAALGFVINGIAAGDQSGFSVSGAGDFNGDGLDDLIVGAYQADPDDNSAAGASYVVFGKTDGTAVNLSAVAANAGGGFVINGIAAGDQSGLSVSGAGDFNGDGFDDLIVGSDQADPHSNIAAGASYVVFGKDGGTAVNLSAVAAGAGGGFVINGIAAGDQSGFSVSGAGDVNHDGLDDLIVGAYQADPDGNSAAGASYVVFGKTDGTAVNLSAVAAGAGGGFVINGIAAGDQSGLSVSGAGDVNGDGFDDLIVGSDQADPHGNIAAGASYVVFGKDGGTAVNLSAVAAGAGGGFVINGIAAGDQSGFSVSGAGDVNHDGLDDLIVGAYQADPDGNSAAGESYVVFGKTDGAPVELADLLPNNADFLL